MILTNQKSAEKTPMDIYVTDNVLYSDQNNHKNLYFSQVPSEITLF